ncbi:CatB-related O-acetyltransferase [Aeromonas allosaccharophila]|uniref:CatB-related O-acetyltransferase n=1 Tax=Aeromonas allosaccharophila TaxID=656 RepID=UPI0009E1E14C
MPYIKDDIKYPSIQTPERLLFKNSPICETPISIGCSSHFDIKKIGAFTYIRSGCTFKNVERIGRFCSIAPNCTFGPEEHNMEFITTSSILNSQAQWNFSVLFNDFWNENIQSLKRVRLMLNDLNFRNNKKISIGNDVWIGQNVTVLRGVTIGDGAVIGANSVVTKNVPPYSIVAGVPAREIKKRFNDETISLLMEAKWWNYSISVISGIDLSNALNAARFIINNREKLLIATYNEVSIR